MNFALGERIGGGLGLSLGLSQQDIAKLGAFGVVRGAVRLFGSRFPSLVWIQFMLVLPYSLYLIVDQYAQQSIIHTLFPDLPSPPSLPITSWDDFGNLDLQKGLGILLLAFLMLLSFSLSLVIVAAVFHAVRSIHDGNNVTFSQVLHAVPRLWSRLLVTAIVDILLLLSVGVAYAIFMVIFHFTVPATVLPLLAAVFGVIFLIPIFIITLMSQVANGVTCFEEHFGITAFRRAKHILHDKWGSAVLLFILLAIPGLLVGLLIQSPVKLNNEFHWRWLVLSIFYVIFTSYLTELICIAGAIFYISCAVNYASIRHDHDDQLEAGYQPIAPAPAIVN